MITATAARPRRFSLTERTFMRHQDRLLAYITDRMPAADWHTAEDLAQETWLEALLSGPLGDATGDDLPAGLAAAARRVVRRRTSPVPAGDAQWELLTQILGRADTWPEHWHRVLVEAGQPALLQLAAVELAAVELEREQPTPARARVVPLPSAVFPRSRPRTMVAA